MMRIACAILIALLGTVTCVLADSVTLRGSSIPLRNCTVQDIRNGRVYYSDARGRRQWRELNDMAALSFDDLPQLDEAERLLAAGEDTDGLCRLLQALLGAEAELPRLWLRVRLVRAHDLRGEYVQAAGHLAALCMLREDSSWRGLEPLSQPDRPRYEAAAEALGLLEEARRVVSNRDLLAVLDRLLARVRPIHDDLEAAYDGPAIESGSTHSGYGIEQIRAGRLEGATTPAPPPREAPAVEASPPSPEPAPAMRVAPSAAPSLVAPSGDQPDAIDALLDAGRFDEALAACERLARRPGDRSLSRFLHQYGRALQGAGRPRDAAVMLLRCAVLYDSSPHAPACLLDAALICRDAFGNAAAARRLLEKAIEAAVARRRDDVAERARAAMENLEETARN